MANYGHPNALPNTAQWFEIARPEPTAQHVTTQVGVHFEEVSEMLEEMAGDTSELNDLINYAQDANHNLAEYLKKNPGSLALRSRIKFLDALCDQIVTVVGTAHMFKMDIVGALNETNRENFSKFDDKGQPITDPNTGKIMKGPNYLVSDLTPFI